MFKKLVWPAYKESGAPPDALREVVERLKPLSVASLVTAYEVAMDDTKREGIARRTQRSNGSCALSVRASAPSATRPELSDYFLKASLTSSAASLTFSPACLTLASDWSAGPRPPGARCRWRRRPSSLTLPAASSALLLDLVVETHEDLLGLSVSVTSPFQHRPRQPTTPTAAPRPGSQVWTAAPEASRASTSAMPQAVRAASVSAPARARRG